MKSTHHLNVLQRVGVVEQAVNVTSTEELIKQMANRSIFSAEALQRSIAKFWPSTNPLSLKTFAERSKHTLRVLRRAASHESNHWQSALLRPRHVRPCYDRPPKQKTRSSDCLPHRA
jgi:hypothetical protein